MFLLSADQFDSDSKQTKKQRAVHSVTAVRRVGKGPQKLASGRSFPAIRPRGGGGPAAGPAAAPPFPEGFFLRWFSDLCLRLHGHGWKTGMDTQGCAFQCHFPMRVRGRGRPLRPATWRGGPTVANCKPSLSHLSLCASAIFHSSVRLPTRAHARGAGCAPRGRPAMSEMMVLSGWLQKKQRHWLKAWQVREPRAPRAPRPARPPTRFGSLVRPEGLPGGAPPPPLRPPFRP